MPNKQLIDYVKQYKNKHAIETIKNNLIQQGYDPNEVEEAIRVVREQSIPAEPEVSQEKSNKPVLIVAVIIILLLAIIGGYFYFSKSSEPSYSTTTTTIGLTTKTTTTIRSEKPIDDRKRGMDLVNEFLDGKYPKYFKEAESEALKHASDMKLGILSIGDGIVVKGELTGEHEIIDVNVFTYRFWSEQLGKDFVFERQDGNPDGNTQELEVSTYVLPVLPYKDLPVTIDEAVFVAQAELTEIDKNYYDGISISLLDKFSLSVLDKSRKGNHYWYIKFWDRDKIEWEHFLVEAFSGEVSKLETYEYP